MAGKRQHYLPRFLLKGFASRTQGSKDFVWYFRKGGTPAEVSIRDIALQKNFYGPPGQDSLDEKLTKEETEYSAALSRVKKLATVSDADKLTICHFVVDLVVRTKYLRSGAISAFDDMLSMFSRNLCTADKVNDFMAKRKNDISRKAEKKVKKELRKFGIYKPHLVKEFLSDRNMDKLIKEMAPTAANVMQTALTEVKSNLEDQGTQAHISGLEKRYASEKLPGRFQRYSSYYWNVKYFEPGSLILGDLACFEISPDGVKSYPAITKEDKDGILVVPVSNECLLIGSPNRSDFGLSPEIINSASAELSADFFVSSKNSEREKDLHDKMGLRCKLFSDEELDRAEQEFFGEQEAY